MTVPTASSAPTPPVVTLAGLGRACPNPAISGTGGHAAGSLGVCHRINEAPGQFKGLRPTSNSA